MLNRSQFNFTILTIVTAMLLSFHAWHYMPYFADDSLISLQYVKRFLEGHGLTWTDGRAVEGYSNLLWILILSALSFTTIDLITLSRLLGWICSVGICVLVSRHYSKEKNVGILQFVGIALGLLLYVGAGPVAVWSIAGLEMPLYCLLIVASTLSLFDLLSDKEKSINVSFLHGASLGALCLTRPDAPIFVTTSLVTLLISRFIDRNSITIKSIAIIFLIPFFCILSQLLFRLFYYQSWIPNTALVKIAPSYFHIKDGFDYLYRGVTAFISFFILGIFGLIFILRSKENRLKGFFILSSAFTWCCYVVLVGGDIFVSFRLILPVYTFLALAIVEGASAIPNELFRKNSYFKIFLFLIICAAITSHFFQQQGRRELIAAHTERWEWDGEVVGKMLGQAFGSSKPLIAVTAAGCIPYWSNLPSIDMLGLNDYYLPRHPPANFGQGKLAHELGDADYILGRNPDLIIFHVGLPTPIFHVGKVLQESEVFMTNYQLVTLIGSRPYQFKSSMWINRLSDKVAVRANVRSGLAVPPYLFFEKQPGDVSYVFSEDKVFSASVSSNVELQGYILKDRFHPKMLEQGPRWKLEASDLGQIIRISLKNVTNEPQIFTGLYL